MPFSFFLVLSSYSEVTAPVYAALFGRQGNEACVPPRLNLILIKYFPRPEIMSKRKSRVLSGGGDLKARSLSAAARRDVCASGARARAHTHTWARRRLRSFEEGRAAAAATASEALRPPFSKPVAGPSQLRDGQFHLCFLSSRALRW